MSIISVIIPTYKRGHDLYRCLQALLSQVRIPDEIIVAARESDEETSSIMKLHYSGHPLMRVVSVATPGQVAALNAGLDSAKGDLIAITDDDAVPRADWLLRIEEHFESDSRLGGLGGRDWVHHNGRIEDGSHKTVGKVQWFGRVIGNHHLGIGGARGVDLLKGANMSYRRSAIDTIRFQPCLKGTGAQVYNDMDFSMAVKKKGWKLLYDPQVAVDHYPAPRFDEDKRNSKFNPVALLNMTHNETFVLFNNLGVRQRIFFLLWVLGVGSTSSPGFIQWLRLLTSEGTLANKKWYTVIRGRLDGIRTWLKRSQG
jgi:glycosyltransferase involved in cell wall biosynthesis